MFLLAQFRETRAHPLMVKIAELPGDLLDSLFGDFVTEGYGKALASTCGGNLAGIESIVENANADEWVRGAALSALVTLVASGIKTREEILAYFTRLFRGGLTDTNRIVWSDLVCFSTDLYATELLADIEKTYERDLVDRGIIRLEDVERDFARGEDWALNRLTNDPHRKLIQDTVKEYGSWSCFHRDEGDRADKTTEVFEPPEETWSGSIAPYRRDSPKIGRNEPCPCGSGKKYKRCCGR
jgi:hypothetical protein